MNKVFKVIWSEARNAYVVVSKMAKSHGTKSCSTKKLLAMLIATGIMTCASVAPAMAANLAPDDYQIEAGNGASASGQGSVAIGNNAQASGLVGIAIGRDAVASGGDSIAIGSDTKATQIYSVAIGNDISYIGYSSTAIGQQTYATGDVSTAIGTMTNIDAEYNATHDDWRKAGYQSTAIGAYSGSWGIASTALGGYSRADEKFATAVGYGSHATAERATTLGAKAEANAYESVAIGSFSVADREGGMVGAFAPEGADGLTWKANAGAVSVGSSVKDKEITRQITNVAAGTEATDAVNVAQLQEATQNVAWHLSAEEEITGDINSRTKINHGDTVHFQGTDDNITISKEETEDATVMHVALSRNLVINSVQAGDFFMNNEKGIGFGGEAYITQNGLNANDKVITNVAAGTADTDAVNVSQLNKVSVEAGKHSVVTEGANITVTPEQAEDGRMQYNVALNNDILLSGDNDAFVNISGSNGSVWASSSVAAGNVIMDGTTATVSGLGNTTTAYDGFANGEGKAATEEQLKEISKVADNANQGWNLATNGGEASKVAPGETVDISGDKNIKTSNDGTNVKVKLNENIDVNSVQTNALNSKYNLSVGTMAENGIMPFFVNSTGDFYAAHNKFSVDKDGNMNANSVQTNALNSKYNLSVGTANADGTVPFFVNSNGAFYAANGKLVVDKDGKLVAPEAELGKVTADEGEIGNVVLKDGVFYKHTALRDGELFVGDADGNYSQITTKGAKLGQVVIAEDGKISNVAAGVADTDAVNVGQLKEAVEAGNTDTHIKPGEYGVGADNTVNMDVVDKNGNKVDTVTIKDVAKASDVGDVNNIASDIKNQDGSHTTVVDAVNNLNNKVGDLNYVEGGKGNYVTNGENTTTSIGKLDKALKDVADTAAKHTKVEGGNNITVTNTAKEGEAANYKVELNKDIDVDTVTANTVTTGQTVMNNDGVKVGTDVSLNKDGLKVGDKVSVSATAVTAGQTSINNDGLAVGPNTSLKADELKVDGKTYIDKNGLNANGMQITNVADGKENSDAVNVGQLKESEKTINNRIDGVENQVVNNTNRINKLGSRVNKVGAGAAALAALHPMDFDPDDKLTFSAGYGNYAGENAAAIGAYYRPDEKVMFSVAGTVGNGENMVNAGVSFALDRTNHVSNSRTALAREVIDLRGQLAVMGAKMAKMEKAFGMLDETKTKLFPDVPANHWAYEYIAKLAGNGYIEGYPDGNFGGDRLMTRYEFAAMLYRAIENGAALEEKIIKEFEPELGRIRVDRISGEDGDRDKIERVRVNDTKGERDHYGNKLAK